MSYFEVLPQGIVSELDPAYNKFLFDEEEQENLRKDLQLQYMYLSNLGVNLLENVAVKDETLLEMISFINDNYIPLSNIDDFINDPKMLQVFGIFIYELVCVDLIKIFDETTQDIESHILTKVAVLRDLVTNTADNIELKNELLKWTYYLDILDNDKEFIYNNLINPVKVRWQDTLN